MPTVLTPISGIRVIHMAEEIDHAKHLLRKCTHEMQDMSKEWDNLQHAQKTKSVTNISHELERLEVALDYQGHGEPRSARIVLGGIFAVLVMHFLYNLIASA